MSDDKPKAPKRTISGENPSVKEMRAKFDSIQEGTLADVEALNARISENLKRAKEAKEQKDARREPHEDDRRDSLIPDDVVELEEKDPFPSPPPPAPEKK